MKLKKEKIIKLLYGLPSFSIGGIENQLTQQLVCFDKNKYEIHIVTLFYYKGRPNFYEQLPPHVITHNFNFNGYFDIKNYFKLFKLLNSIEPNIVVSSMFSANAIFRIMKLFFGYKIITREHNTYTDRTVFHKITEKLLSPLSNLIIAVSKDVADFYCHQNKILRNKVLIINNGIDLEKIQEFGDKNINMTNFKKELGLAGSDKVIINVARLKAQKNHELLIDVFADFQKMRSNYRLFILGDGQEREALSKKIIELKLSNEVRLFGFRKDVFNFYQISNFFVLSSRIEGFPNVFLEALAFGLPVITTNVPGANEIIINGRNGFIVKNQEELLEKMLYLSNLDIKKMEILRQECLNTVKNFSIQKIVGQYETIFSKLLK